MHDASTDQAIVLGASMAGLLAARVLSERFKGVVVVERDVLPPPGEHRRGVPHGKHIHALHPRGVEILDELFPGFSTSLAASGAVLCDILGESRWQLSGHQLRQSRTGLMALAATRPFLEGHVRARVLELPGIRILQGTADALTTPADRRTVTGVQVHGPDGSLSQVAGSLVIDATARGSRTPAWLAELGYQGPVRERVEIGLGYATRFYRLRPGAMGRPPSTWPGILLWAPTWASPRSPASAQ
jgi:2-polyprenyl-6-methoxyphenol hydroxylase-like FAD-dependent oxidoreductase